MIHGALCLSLAALALFASAQESSAPPSESADEPALPAAPELLAPEVIHERASELAEQLDCLELLPLYPGLASRAGRPLFALRVAAPDAMSTGAGSRPAILLAAGLDGHGAFASALAWTHAFTLARNYASNDEAAREFLSRATLLVVPCANPDALASRFATPREARLATGAAVDRDRDGRVGEDGPADVDGDGVVRWMRVLDPEGTWTEDPADARAMKPAAAAEGEVGRWRLMPEGLDDDGDDEVAEDPPQAARVDANFAHGWKEHAPEAGRFALDEPEARALAEFVMLHEELALVVSYGRLDDLVESPKAVDAKPGQRIPPDGVLSRDAGFLAELGRRYREAVEHEARSWSEAMTAGSFQAWAYQHRGLPSLSIVPWDIPLDGKTAQDAGSDEPGSGNPGSGNPGSGKHGASEPAEAEPAETKAGDRGAKRPGKQPERETSEDAKRLAWIDAEGPDEAWRFAEWKPFEHPTLGTVELGGLDPHAREEPPAEVARRVRSEQYGFLLALAEALPAARLEGNARALGGGLVELEVAVVAGGLLPVRGAKAIDTRVVRPPRLELLLPEGARLVAGRALELLDEADLAGGARAKRRWLVAGLDAGAELGLRLSTEQAGSDQLRLTVTEQAR